jgi:hypothetical protein
MKMRIRNNLSVLLIALIYILLNFSLKLWKEPQKIIANDVIDYYAYLPALIIYDDISLNFKETNGEFFADKIWGFKQENGKYVLKMSAGLAIMYSPFFLLSHLYALSSVHPADGYSVPYGVGILIASLFYFIAGLLLLRKLLRLYFTEFTVTIVLVLVALATNVSNYIIREPGMSHTFSFFLFSAFLLLTQRWHQKADFKNSLLTGLVVGLITLVRPSNAVIILIFLLWNVVHFKSFIEKLKFLLSRWKWILLIALFTMIIWIPQLLYWKSVTGHWFHYSYNNEGFYFLKPKIIQVLMGFRKGWLIYTPVMFFALLGFYRLFKIHKQFFWGLTAFTVLNIYIISSWWCWWYGGSFGHRAMIESYAVMALPLAAFIQYAGRSFRLRKTTVVLCTLLLIGFNFFQNFKYFNNSIHYDSMTKLAWVESITKLHPTQLYYDLLMEPDYASALEGKKEQHPEKRINQKNDSAIDPNAIPIVSELYYQDFSITDAVQPSDMASHVIQNEFRTQNHAYLLNNQQIFRPEFVGSLKELNDQKVRWILAEVFYKPQLPHEEKTLAIVVSFESGHEVLLYHAEFFISAGLSENEWNHAVCMLPVPQRKSDTDTFKCYIWNIDGKAKGIIDDFRILKVY